jgi:hypothetical protein
MIEVASIDYSMTCPALCILRGGIEWEHATVHFLTDKIKMQGKFAHGRIVGTPYPHYTSAMDRYTKLAAWSISAIESVPWEVKPKIYLEDYAMGAKGKVFSIAENTAILKYYLWLKKYDVQTVAPTALKKQATGKGSGKKELMGKKFFELTGVDLAKTLGYDGSKPYDVSPLSDVADSFLLARYGAQLL